MFYADFSDCLSLLRMLEVALEQPYQSFGINVVQGKGRIERDGKVPFIASWQSPVELAVTLNAMIAVLEYKKPRDTKHAAAMPEKCGDGLHASPHVDCFLR